MRLVQVYAPLEPPGRVHACGMSHPGREVGGREEGHRPGATGRAPQEHRPHFPCRSPGTATGGAPPTSTPTLTGHPHPPRAPALQLCCAAASSGGRLGGTVHVREVRGSQMKPYGRSEEVK